LILRHLRHFQTRRHDCRHASSPYCRRRLFAADDTLSLTRARDARLCLLPDDVAAAAAVAAAAPMRYAATPPAPARDQPMAARAKFSRLSIRRRRSETIYSAHTQKMPRAGMAQRQPPPRGAPTLSTRHAPQPCRHDMRRRRYANAARRDGVKLMLRGRA